MDDIIAGDYNGFIYVTVDGVAISGSGSCGDIELGKSAVVSVSIVDETQKEKFSKGWGAVGLIAVGPVGLFAGALAKTKSVSRVLDVRFRDGKKILVKDSDGSLFEPLQKLAFDSDANFAKEQEDARIDALIAANRKPEKPLDPETAKLVEKYKRTGFRVNAVWILAAVLAVAVVVVLLI